MARKYPPRRKCRKCKGVLNLIGQCRNILCGRREAPGGTRTTGWPMKSVALAVQPRQVPEATERAKRHGINVTYDPNTGDAHIPDAGNRKKLMKLEGFFDRDAFC